MAELSIRENLEAASNPEQVVKNALSTIEAKKIEEEIKEEIVKQSQ